MPPDLDAQFARHRQAFARQPFPPAAERIDPLDRLEALVKEHAGEWAEAISRDFGGRSARADACAGPATLPVEFQ